MAWSRAWPAMWPLVDRGAAGNAGGAAAARHEWHGRDHRWGLHLHRDRRHRAAHAPGASAIAAALVHCIRPIPSIRPRPLLTQTLNPEPRPPICPRDFLHPRCEPLLVYQPWFLGSASLLASNAAERGTLTAGTRGAVRSPSPSAPPPLSCRTPSLSPFSSRRWPWQVWAALHACSRLPRATNAR